MKLGKTLILALLLALLMAGNATAAKLTVIKQGNGDGEVSGEGIACGDNCTEIYPDETIVPLTAEPDEYSEFKGWLVDGKPQEGTLVIRKDVTVTAIFEKKPTSLVPEFEIVGTRPSEFDYSKDFYPLYDTKGEVVGALQEIKTADQVKWNVLIRGKATFIIPWIDAVLLPTDRDRVVAYGEYSNGFHETLGIIVSDLSFYSFNGTLLKSVNINIDGPFCVANVSNNGDFGVAGTRGNTMYDPIVLRRYTPEGELLWEQLLPELTPRRLVFSPDNRYVALILQKLSLAQTILRIYAGDGRIVSERELPRSFYGVKFVTDQKVLLYSGWEWGLYQLQNLASPFVSGRFAGNPFELHPILVFPLADCFLIRTAVGKKVTTSYHLQAVHRETGKILAERLFDASSVQTLEFYRITAQGSFEVLMNGKTIMELRIPKLPCGHF